MDAKQKLEQEIAQKRKELEKLEQQAKLDKRSSIIRKLEDVPAEEKIRFFDSMFSNALRILEEKENGTGRIEPEDDAHYTWESVMEILSANGEVGFWSYWNSLK